MLKVVAALAPLWLNKDVSCIVFHEESDGDTPGAQFWAKRPTNMTNALLIQNKKEVVKSPPMAPLWTKLGVPYIVFCEESDGDTPGAQFWAKTTKNSKQIFESKNQKYEQKWRITQISK